MLQAQQNKMWGELRSLTSTLPAVLDRDFRGRFNESFRQIVQTEDFKIYQGEVHFLRSCTEDEQEQVNEIYEEARQYVVSALCTRSMLLGLLECTHTELGANNLYCLHSERHIKANLHINKNPQLAVGRKMFFETMCLASEDEVRIWSRKTAAEEINSFFLIPANTLRVEDNFESYTRQLIAYPLSKH